PLPDPIRVSIRHTEEHTQHPPIVSPAVRLAEYCADSNLTCTDSEVTNGDRPVGKLAFQHHGPGLDPQKCDPGAKTCEDNERNQYVAERDKPPRPLHESCRVHDVSTLSELTPSWAPARRSVGLWPRGLTWVAVVVVRHNPMVSRDKWAPENGA